MTERWRGPSLGNPGAPVLVVCDAQGEEAKIEGLPMASENLKWLASVFKESGLRIDRDVHLVSLCPPVPIHDLASAARRWTHVNKYVPELRRFIQSHTATGRNIDLGPRLIVTFGELATRALLGRAVKITKARGLVVVRDEGPPVLAMLSPGFVRRLPEHEPVFRADMHTVAMLSDADYDVSRVERPATDYRWVTDLDQYFRNARPRFIAVDTETTGLRWWDPDVVILTVQISASSGKAAVCPLDQEYWERWLGPVVGEFDRGVRDNLVGQLRDLLEDPTILKVGQNIKYDHHLLRETGIRVRGWSHDTMVMGFAVNENMLSLSQDELVRVYVPDMAGYADEFNAKYDKARMRDVPPDDMLPYAGGDPDACLRLCRSLAARMSKDPKQIRVYRKIQVPAVMCFADVTERGGMLVDRDKLRDLGAEVDDWLDREFRRLIRLVPVRVRRRHLNRRKPLRFSRAQFVIDTLFRDGGFGLTPVVFTKGTRDLPPAQQIPSTSVKEHFPYLVNDRTPIEGDVALDEDDRLIKTVGDFVHHLIEFQRTRKIRSTYYGNDEEGTGFWQYLDEEGNLHPSFGVTFTNTGRTNSRDPNAQNFPKRRSRFAKMFGEVFVPHPGCVFVAGDLSQIELRIAAWMAMEPTMLRIFREGGDVHVTTAADTIGVDPAEFIGWKGSENPLIEYISQYGSGTVPGADVFLQAADPISRAGVTIGDYYEQKRFEAKSINFGFIFGMWWPRFVVYAKTDYGLDITDEDAERFRNAFFNRYQGYLPWHDTMREFAREHGYVRALHGAKRHLPSVYSSDKSIRSAAERYAINSPVQRLGSDLGLMAFILLTMRADPRVMRVINFVHDQLIMEVREDHAEEAGSALKWTMESPPLERWFDITAPVPIVSDITTGTSLGTMSDMVGVKAIKPNWWIEDDGEAEDRFHRIVDRGRDSHD